MDMTDARAHAVPPSLQDALTLYLHRQEQIEIVFRDPAGQIQTLHTRIRDLFVRPGGCFIALEPGQLVPLDHVLLLNGQALNPY